METETRKSSSERKDSGEFTVVLFCFAGDFCLVGFPKQLINIFLTVMVPDSSLESQFLPTEDRPLRSIKFIQYTFRFLLA